ncbi:MAG: hypothetical protein J5789_01245 [Oscillospiraceae bacterium]|nr:hypothetical protein [Oscillospiraceae bacterium]
MKCPNCGCESSSWLCPNCGAVLAKAPDPQTAAADGVEAELKGLLSGTRILGKQARSPLMLLSAILVTVYAIGACIYCGGLIRGRIGYTIIYGYSSLQSSITAVEVTLAFLRLAMALWLLGTMWVLYGSRASVGVLKNCRVYVRFRLIVFGLLTLCLLTLCLLVVVIGDFGSGFHSTLAALTAGGIAQAGFSAIEVLSASPVQFILVIAAVFILGAIRSAFLSGVFSDAIRLSAGGNPVKKRIMPAAVLTILAGAGQIIANLFLLLRLEKKSSWRFIERGVFCQIVNCYGCIALGVALILCAVVLLKYAKKLGLVKE